MSYFKRKNKRLELTLKENSMDIKVIIGDFHAPAGEISYIKQISDYIKHLSKFKANKIKVIQMGDLLDAKAWSKYPKGPSDDNAQLEWDRAVIQLDKFAQLIPEMTIISSNHDIRLMKSATSAQLPRQMVKTLAEIFDYPGWNWHLSEKPLVIDNVAYVHGDGIVGNTMGLKAIRMGMSVVMGHSHVASLQYYNHYDREIFGMEVGCTVDSDNAAFNYAIKNTKRHWHGFAIIQDGVPHLIPLKK
jgi:hypothetical protein